MSTVFDYAPAPESRAIVDIKPSYGLFSDGQFVDGTGTSFKTVNPATEEVLAEVAEASDADVDAAVKAARRAYTRVWSKMSGAERAKYLYRIARIIQERGRELAVLESIDNGKPIKESRDVDVPIVAAHFFYYAGWADKLKYSGFGDTPLGVAGQDWLDPDWFRFGASTLLNDLLMQRTKMTTGRYSGPDYFTLD